MAVATWKDIDALHRAVNSIRERRKALKAANDPGGMDARLAAIEEQLMQVKIKSTEGNLNYPDMLNEQIYNFASLLEDADTAPTVQETTTYAGLHAQLAAQLAAWTKLKTGPLAQLRAQLQKGEGK